MEKKTPRPMTPFDELTTPYPLSILKLMLPYIAPGGGSSLWILVKFMELKYTISITRHPEQILSSHSFDNLPDSPVKLLDEIAPYLPPEQAQMADSFRNIMNMMEMMQMMQSFNDSSENASETGGIDSMFSGMNPMDMMMGMLSPEQQEMFQMYQNMFSDNDNSGNTKQENAEQENFRTGDDNDERMDEQPSFKGHGFPEAGSDPNGSLPDNR